MVMRRGGGRKNAKKGVQFTLMVVGQSFFIFSPLRSGLTFFSTFTPVQVALGPAAPPL